ncbi:MAG: diguanylate cyclase, partial [Gammaproteobacteria bacterium]
DALANGPLAALLHSDTSVQLDGHGSGSRYLKVSAVSLAGDDDGHRAQVLVYRDVTAETRLRTQVEHLNQALEAETTSDPATGLLNRRGLLLALEPQVARSRRYERPLSVIVAELAGERGPDPWLTGASRLLKDQLRWADLVAHTEHGRFVIALPETDSGHAETLGVKLGGLLGELCAQDGSSPQVRVGVSSWRRSDSATALLRRAVQRLDDDPARICAAVS